MFRLTRWIVAPIVALTATTAGRSITQGRGFARKSGFEIDVGVRISRVFRLRHQRFEFEVFEDGVKQDIDIQPVRFRSSRVTHSRRSSRRADERSWPMAAFKCRVDVCTHTPGRSAGARRCGSSSIFNSAPTTAAIVTTSGRLRGAGSFVESCRQLAAVRRLHRPAVR